MSYKDKLIRHYSRTWAGHPTVLQLEKGPINEVNKDFCILEYPAGRKRKMWTYATCNMSDLREEHPIELHLFSADRDRSTVELLTAIAHFNLTSQRLDLWHTVNFGRPWKKYSICTYGLISLPYLDGPDLENFKPDGIEVKCYWLIPVTKEEVLLKKQQGVEALEERFEERGFNYLDAGRKSVV